MAAPTLVDLVSGDLSAQINLLGAELWRLRGPAGEDLLWDGDPGVWSGRAPLLFPIIGALAKDRYTWAGRAYSLPKHGFARRRGFVVAAQSDTAVTLRLDADAETLAAYPFNFRLDMSFALHGDALTMTAQIFNRGDGPMPASFGFHPALRRPLPYGQARGDHRILFAQDEPAPIRRLGAAGTLQAAAYQTPVQGRVLALDDALFAADAVIFDQPRSRRLAYGAPAGPQLDIAFDGLPHLGVWSKPGAGYVCIEPWHGLADPAGFDGDLGDKPGVFLLAPGEMRPFAMTLALTGAAS